MNEKKLERVIRERCGIPSTDWNPMVSAHDAALAIAEWLGEGIIWQGEARAYKRYGNGPYLSVKSSVHMPYQVGIVASADIATPEFDGQAVHVTVIKLGEQS